MDYEGCGPGPDMYDDYGTPAPRVQRRPWWWWLAFGFYASAVLTAAWVAYRAMAGWPVGLPLLMRLAG